MRKRKKERKMLHEAIRYYVGECRPPAFLAGVALTIAVFSGGVPALAGVNLFRFEAAFVDVFFIIFGILFLASMAWMVIRFRMVLECFRLEKKCQEKKEKSEKMKGVVCNEGGNRTGKSLDGHAILYFKAIAIWKYVRRQTLLWMAKMTKEPLTQQEENDFREIKGTYDRFKDEKDLIPCLVTNVRVDDVGKQGQSRTGTELRAGHFIQKYKLPMPCAVGLDESSDKLSNDLYKDKEGSAVIDRMLRWLNQFTGDMSIFVYMEQNSSRAYKGERDSVCVVRNMKGLKILLPPKRLLRKLDEYYEELDEMEEPPEYGFAMKVLNLQERIRKIGVIELNLTEYGNKESAAGEILSGGIIQEYLPCDLPFFYETRWFRTGYLCKNDDIILFKFKGRLQSEEMTEDRIRLLNKVVTCEGEVTKDWWNEEKAKMLIAEQKRREKEAGHA